MKIHSTRMGDVVINDAEIITFSDGIIGFPDYKRYVEIDFLEGSPLRLLQAVDKPDLGFIFIDPLLFMADYILDASDDDIASLNAGGLEDFSVWVIITVPEDPYEMTANLKGPIIVNKRTRLAKQIVNNDKRYTTKHRVLAKPETSTVGA